MYLIVLAWLYVTLMMALVEAFSTQGSVLGAIITFLLYGALPITLVVYVMGTPLRRKARQVEDKTREASGLPPSGREPDASGHATRLSDDTGIAPVRKKP